VAASVASEVFLCGQSTMPTWFVITRSHTNVWATDTWRFIRLFHCCELFGTFRRSATSVSRRPSNTVIAARLINSGLSPQHLAERSASATSNQRCAVCSERHNRAKCQDPSASNSALPKRTKTVYRCTACNVYLCVGTGKDNCFAVYHSLVDYWR